MTSKNSIRTALVTIALAGAAFFGTQAAHADSAPAAPATQTQTVTTADDATATTTAPTPTPTATTDNNPWD